MNAAELLQVVRALSSLIELANSVGLDVRQVLDFKVKAKAEGRDLSDDELLQLSSSAQDAIDAARNA